MSKRVVIWLGMLAVLALSGCASWGDDEREKTSQLTEDQLYERVQLLLDDKRYANAVQNLQLLESRFPFGAYAEQAQLEIIFAYFKNLQEASAVAAAERFIRLHPDHPDVDYAWYMKGLANYSLQPGIFSRFYDRDFSLRDVAPAKTSFREFQAFLKRFPNSQYAGDARQRMLFIREILARHELNVANYYLKRGAYLAAVNRANAVLNEYQNTQAIADALGLMAFCYRQLDMQEASSDALAVLRHNFPDYPALNADGNLKPEFARAYEERSTLNRLTLGLVDPPRAPQFHFRQF